MWAGSLIYWFKSQFSGGCGEQHLAFPLTFSAMQRLTSDLQGRERVDAFSYHQGFCNQSTVTCLILNSGRILRFLNSPLICSGWFDLLGGCFLAKTGNAYFCLGAVPASQMSKARWLLGFIFSGRGLCCVTKLLCWVALLEYSMKWYSHPPASTRETLDPQESAANQHVGERKKDVLQHHNQP